MITGEPLFTLTLEPAAEGSASARPFAAGGESLLERGTGRAEGPALSGALRYSRRLERRAGGLAVVAFHVLVADVAGTIVVLEGDGREDDRGAGLAVFSWTAQAEPYLPLNGAILLGELRPGSIAVYASAASSPPG